MGAFRKLFAFEAFLTKVGLRAADLPEHLQAAIRLFNADFAAAGNKLTPELEIQAAAITEDVQEWHEEEEDEPVAAPEPVPAPEPAPEPEPVPEVSTDPLTPAQVLMQLHGQGRTKVRAAELKAAGFTPNPGPSGGSWGAYRLTKALFDNTYTLTKTR